MKQHISKSEIQTLSPKIQKIITEWKNQKGYLGGGITTGAIIEMLDAFSRNHRNEEILHGVKNHVLDMEEVVIGWDGDELIDTLFFLLIKLLAWRLSGKGDL